MQQFVQQQLHVNINLLAGTFVAVPVALAAGKTSRVLRQVAAVMLPEDSSMIMKTTVLLKDNTTVYAEALISKELDEIPHYQVCTTSARSACCIMLLMTLHK